MLRGTFEGDMHEAGHGHTHDKISDNRACSSMGGFLRAKSNRTQLETQRKKHQKLLGLTGVGFLVLGAALLYFSSPILGALMATLGAATTGYIPWIHAPTKPLVFSWMPENTSQQANPNTYPAKLDVSSPEIRQEASVSPSSEDMLRAAGGEKPMLSFSPTVQRKSFGRLEGTQAKNKDTFDLIAKLPTKSPR